MKRTACFCEENPRERIFGRVKSKKQNVILSVAKNLFNFKKKKGNQTMAKFLEVLMFIKEIIADDAKMSKFREVIADLKELVSDIKDAVELFKKKEEKEA